MPKTTRPQIHTYLDRRARVWEVRLAGPAGFRRIFFQWIDDAHPKNGGYPAGTIRTKLVLGDGRDPNMEAYENRTVTPDELANTDWHADLEKAATALFETPSEEELPTYKPTPKQISIEDARDSLVDGDVLVRFTTVLDQAPLNASSQVVALTYDELQDLIKAAHATLMAVRGRVDIN